MSDQVGGNAHANRLTPWVGVFSTKNRRQSIPQDLSADLHAYLAGAVRALGGEAYRVGGTEDHVRLACSLPRTLTVSKLLEEIKKSSSAWFKSRDTRCHGFSRQAGYGAFSLGQSQLAAVVRYIESEQEPHRGRSFEQEFRDLLGRYGVDYEERGVGNDVGGAGRDARGRRTDHLRG